MRSLLKLLSYSKASPPKSFLFLDRNLPIEEETTPDYNPKNVLPVELGVLLNDRYRVASKVGHGRACTIWLAKDTQKYRACIVHLEHFVTHTSTDGHGKATATSL